MNQHQSTSTEEGALPTTVETRIKVIPSFGKGTLPTLVFKVRGRQGYPFDLSPGVSYKRYVSKTKYMTLGQKLFSYIKMAVTRRRKHLNQSFLAGSPALDASYLYSRSKQDLKHFSKSYIFGFASAVFTDFSPRRET